MGYGVLSLLPVFVGDQALPALVSRWCGACMHAVHLHDRDVHRCGWLSCQIMTWLEPVKGQLCMCGGMYQYVHTAGMRLLLSWCDVVVQHV